MHDQEDTDRDVGKQCKNGEARDRVAETLNGSEPRFVVDEDRVLVFLLVGQLVECRRQRPFESREDESDVVHLVLDSADIIVCQ